MNLFIEQNHLVKGLDPVADAFAGTVSSDIVKMEEFGRVVFIVYKGVGATGTSTITVEASDDVSASNTSAVPFHYRAVTSTDVPGSVTAATTSGFTTTAGSSQIYAIEVDSVALAADGNGYGYVRLKAVESVNSPVLGGILIIQGEPRYASAVARTQVV